MACVKVIYKNERIVLPVGKGTDKVRVLLDSITTRLRALTGKSAEELKIQGLTTADDFKIDLDDLVQDVIPSGTVVIAIDQKAWLEEQIGLLGKEWTSVVRLDYESNLAHFLAIGLHEYGHIYISYKHGYKNPISFLEVVPAARLLSFDKEGLFEIFSLKSDDASRPWEISAKFSVKLVNSAYIATTILLSCKSSSDPQPEILAVNLKASGNKLEMDSKTTLQEAQTYFAPERLRFAPLVKDVVTGDAITGNLIPAVPFKSFEGNVSKSTNGSALKLEQIEKVWMDETYRSSSYKVFYNRFFTAFRLTNTSKEAVTISKVTSAYLDKNGAETECFETYLGAKGYRDYDFSEPPYNFVVEGGENTLLAIRSAVQLSSLQLEKHRRIHPSLPRPLVLVLRVTDSEGKTAELRVEVGHAERALKSREELEKEGKKVQWFLSADDVTIEERVWAYAEICESNDDKYLSVAHWNGYSRSITKDFLFRTAYEAAKTGKLEHTLDLDVDVQEGAFTAHFALLLDEDKKFPYAIKSVLKTPNSSVTACRLLPDFS